jgi:CDP-diacylglycerol--glycerol-3-phosphate 3-phosphatidyltransferase
MMPAMNLPNRLTVGRIGLTALFVMAMLLPPDGAIMSHFPYGKTLALVIFVVAALTDLWDGWLARHYKQETTFGALLDPVADKILTTAAFVCFIEQPSYRPGVPLVQAWMVLVIIARDFLVTGLRLVASGQGIVLKDEELGKHKTVSQMITVIVTLAGLAARDDWQWRGERFDVLFSRIVFGFMLVTVTLTVWSGFAYFWKNRNLVFHDA